MFFFMSFHSISLFIPGFTLEECTNKELLHHKLEQLDRQLKELTISFKTRYVAKTKKIELKDSLDSKVSYRDMLLRQGHFYKAKRQRLKVKTHNKVTCTLSEDSDHPSSLTRVFAVRLKKIWDYSCL